METIRPVLSFKSSERAALYVRNGVRCRQQPNYLNGGFQDTTNRLLATWIKSKPAG